jgi:hypothetical protein
MFGTVESLIRGFCYILIFLLEEFELLRAHTDPGALFSRVFWLLSDSAIGEIGFSTPQNHIFLSLGNKTECLLPSSNMLVQSRPSLLSFPVKLRTT